VSEKTRKKAKVKEKMKAQYELGVGTVVVGLIIAVFGIVTFFSAFYTVDQTQVGVVTRFGAFQYLADPGPHLKIPFVDGVKMFPRIQVHYEYTDAQEGDLNILTADGLSADAEASLYFQIADPKLVFETIGTNYENWIDGKARGVFREATADFTSDALYTGSKKDELQNTVISRLQKTAGDGFLIKDFQVRRVILPNSTRAAIETKMAAQQTIQTKEFELQATQVEAEKTVAAANGTAQAAIVSAEGQATAIKLVREALTDNYLKYLSITQIANSPNTKLVFMPANNSVLVGFGGLN